jgi:hypothetical protein
VGPNAEVWPYCPCRVDIPRGRAEDDCHARPGPIPNVSSRITLSQTMEYSVGPPITVTVGSVTESYSLEPFSSWDNIMYYIVPCCFHRIGDTSLVEIYPYNFPAYVRLQRHDSHERLGFSCLFQGHLGNKSAYVSCGTPPLGLGILRKPYSW